MSVINLGVPVTLQEDFERGLRKIIDPKIIPDREKEDYQSVSINRLSLRDDADGDARMNFLKSLVPVIGLRDAPIQSFKGSYNGVKVSFVREKRINGGAFGNVYRYVHYTASGEPKKAFVVKMFDQYLNETNMEAKALIKFQCMTNAGEEAKIVDTLEAAGVFNESTAAHAIRIGSGFVRGDVPPMIAMELAEGSLVNWQDVAKEHWTFLDAATIVYAMFIECEHVYNKTKLLYGDFKPANFLFTRQNTIGEMHVIMGDYGSLAKENEPPVGTTFVKPLPDSTHEIGHDSLNDEERKQNRRKRSREWKNTWDTLAFCMGISILTFLELDQNQEEIHFNFMTQDEIDAHMENIFEELTLPETELIKNLLGYKVDPAKPDIRFPERKWNAEDIIKAFKTYNAKFN